MVAAYTNLIETKGQISELRADLLKNTATNNISNGNADLSSRLTDLEHKIASIESMVTVLIEDAEADKLNSSALTTNGGNDRQQPEREDHSQAETMNQNCRQTSVIVASTTHPLQRPPAKTTPTRTTPTKRVQPFGSNSYTEITTLVGPLEPQQGQQADSDELEGDDSDSDYEPVHYMKKKRKDRDPTYRPENNKRHKLTGPTLDERDLFGAKVIRIIDHQLSMNNPRVQVALDNGRTNVNVRISTAVRSNIDSVREYLRRKLKESGRDLETLKSKLPFQEILDERVPIDRTLKFIEQIEEYELGVRTAAHKRYEMNSRRQST